MVSLELTSPGGVVSFLLRIASATTAVPLWRQFIWHLGGRIDAQLLSELPNRTFAPLGVPDTVLQSAKLKLAPMPSTRNQLERYMCQCRCAARAHFGRPLICTYGCDASDVAKANTMNACLIGVDNVLSALAPTVVMMERVHSA